MKEQFIRNCEGKIIGRIDGNWLRDGTGKLALVTTHLTIEPAMPMGKSSALATNGFASWVIVDQQEKLLYHRQQVRRIKAQG